MRPGVAGGEVSLTHSASTSPLPPPKAGFSGWKGREKEQVWGPQGTLGVQSRSGEEVGRSRGVGRRMHSLLASESAWDAGLLTLSLVSPLQPFLVLIFSVDESLNSSRFSGFCGTKVCWADPQPIIPDTEARQSPGLWRVPRQWPLPSPLTSWHFGAFPLSQAYVNWEKQSTLVSSRTAPRTAQITKPTFILVEMVWS